MKPSRSKRFLFGLATAAIVLLAAEVLSHLALGLIHERWFALGSFQEQRLALAGTAGEAAAGSGARPGFVEDAAMHPFVGYVVDPIRSEFEIGDFGYYEAERPLYRRSDDTVILGIFGGSFAHQFRESAIDEVVARLQQDPAYRGKRFIYTSTALGGYKQPQQLMTLNYLLALGGEFDIVVNIDGFNEVALHEAENRSRNVFPAYPRSWFFHTQGLSDPEFVERSAVILNHMQRRRASAGFFAGKPWRWSASANLIWSLRDRSAQKKAEAARAALVAHRTEGERYAATGPAFDQSADDPVFATLADLWERSSLLMSRTARANGIVYVHALQPNQYLEGSKALNEEERRVAFNPDHPYRTGVMEGYPRLIEAGERLRENGVRFLDWTNKYAGVDEQIYVDTCCHVNDRGNALLIDDLVQAILQETREGNP